MLLRKQRELSRFGLGAGIGSDRDVLERHAVKGGELFDLAMIGDDERNFAGQLAGAPAVQQVGHAMQVLRAEERDARRTFG